jgi:hypothetical protein
MFILLSVLHCLQSMQHQCLAASYVKYHSLGLAITEKIYAEQLNYPEINCSAFSSQKR